MNKGSWVAVVVVLVVALGAFYFWPSLQTGLQNQMEQQAAHGGMEATRDPMMSGLWQSNTDAKFTREIRPDGVVIDRYEGDMGAGVGGEWSVVDPAMESALTVPAINLAGMTVIKVVWDGGVETTYFSVNSLSETTLTTTDLTGRGEVTTYTKISQLP